MEFAEQKKVTLSFPSSDSTPAFSLREHPVSRNHSVFREAKNCEAPWGNYFFASGKQRDRGHIKYDKGAVRRRGEKESLTADGLWFTGCSGAKKKLTKRNALKGDALRGIFEKIPLKIP